MIASRIHVYSFFRKTNNLKLLSKKKHNNKLCKSEVSELCSCSIVISLGFFVLFLEGTPSYSLMYDKCTRFSYTTTWGLLFVAIFNPFGLFHTTKHRYYLRTIY